MGVNLGSHGGGRDKLLGVFPTRSYFWNARLKVSNFKAQYLRLHLHSSTTRYRHGSYVTAVHGRWVALAKKKKKERKRSSIAISAGRWMYIYLVDLHGCGVGVRGEVGLLQIESSVGTRQRIYFSLKTCFGTSTQCTYISFFLLFSPLLLIALCEGWLIEHLQHFNFMEYASAATRRFISYWCRAGPWVAIPIRSTKFPQSVAQTRAETLRTSAELLINDAALTFETSQTLAVSFKRKKWKCSWSVFFRSMRRHAARGVNFPF